MRKQARQKLAAEQLMRHIEQPDPVVAAGVQAALILLCLDLGKLTRAHELVQSLAALEPDGYRPHHFMGLILKKLERLEEARDMFLEVLKRDPGVHDAWQELVQCCAQTGDFERALTYLQQASRRDWPAGLRRSWMYRIRSLAKPRRINGGVSSVANTTTQPRPWAAAQPSLARISTSICSRVSLTSSPPGSFS